MRPIARALAVLVLAVLALIGPALAQADPSTTIGNGGRTCDLRPGADCRGVVHRWTVEAHGNLRNARFNGADLRGADFKGADLRNADFRGAILKHVDLRGARLRGARFDRPPKRASRQSAATSCVPNCPGADLTSANLSGASLAYANFSGANLSGADLTYADLSYANLSYAELAYADFSYGRLWFANASYADFSYAVVVGNLASGANLSYTNLTGADFNDTNLTRPKMADVTGATWSNTTCPNGMVTSAWCVA